MNALINHMADADLEESVNTSDIEESVSGSASIKDEEPEVSSGNSSSEFGEDELVSSDTETEAETGNEPASSGSINSDDDESDTETEISSSMQMQAVQTNKRKRRRPEQWIKEVNKYQKGTNLLIQKLSFQRLVREIAQDYRSDLRFTTNTFDAIQTASEDHIIKVLDAAQVVAIHAGRDTISTADIQLVQTVLGIFQR